MEIMEGNIIYHAFRKNLDLCRGLPEGVRKARPQKSQILQKSVFIESL
jgi:hypothetical protein